MNMMSLAKIHVDDPFSHIFLGVTSFLTFVKVLWVGDENSPLFFYNLLNSCLIKFSKLPSKKWG